MSDVIRIDANPASVPVPVELPAPKLPGVTIRPAVLSDYPFIDALQKANSKAVGFMWEKAIKGHIEKGNVLVAVATGAVNSSQCSVNSGDADSTVDCSLGTDHSTGEPVGYLIAVDRYLKRDSWE